MAKKPKTTKAMRRRLAGTCADGGRQPDRIDLQLVKAGLLAERDLGSSMLGYRYYRLTEAGKAIKPECEREFAAEFAAHYRAAAASSASDSKQRQYYERCASQWGAKVAK